MWEQFVDDWKQRPQSSQPERMTIVMKPDCFHPECKMEIAIPSGRDAEEYIDEYLDSILSENIRFNVEWEFV